MAVQVVGSLICSDRTNHQAVSVGQGRWTVSYLPGRTLDTKQAVAAIQVADALADMRPWSRLLGLTPSEALGLAAMESEAQPPRSTDPPKGRRVFAVVSVAAIYVALVFWGSGGPPGVQGVAAGLLFELGATAVVALVLAFMLSVGWPWDPIPRLSAHARPAPRQVKSSGPVTSSVSWACSARPGR